MTWNPDYATVAELKALLLPQGQTTGQWDAHMGVCITAASEAIDKEANRQFGNVSAEARYYTFEGLVVEGRAAISIDDVQDLTGFTLTYEGNTPVITTGYRLWPYNAGPNGKPYTHLLLDNTSPRFPWTAGDVTITANWGWTAVPSAVKLACLLQAGRFFVRKDSLYGIAGSPDAGSEVRLLARLDPDVALNISSVRRWWSALSSGVPSRNRADVIDYYRFLGGWA